MSGSGSQGDAAERTHDLLTACLEEAEAHFDQAIDKLCSAHPDQADAIREELEAVPLGGSGGHSGTSWEGAASNSGSEQYEPIGSYQPLAELGRGGQGLVYLAEDRRLHRVVALKVLNGFGPLSEKLMHRFRREAEVASRLDHPGICAVYDAGVAGGIPFIAMRYVEGETLAQMIRTARAVTAPETAPAGFVDLTNDTDGAPAIDAKPSDTAKKADSLAAVAIIEKAARALHAAHEEGIIHRDVKPGNIMVTPTGEPVWLDFGLASEEANKLSLTQTGDLFGTPAYMSPEQLMAQRIRLDRRTDVYSLAVALFECVTLQKPFEAPTREAMYQAIQYKDAPDPRKLNPRIPADLKVVLEKALEKDRDRRYETALDFAEDLQRVRELKPVNARPVSAAGTIVRWARRRPFRAALVASLVIGLPVITGLVSYTAAKLPDIRAAEAKALADEVEGHLEEGYTELAHGDPEKAIASFDAALALLPANGEAIGGRALALYRARNHAECLAFLDDRGNVEGAEYALERIRIDALRKLEREGEAADLEKRLTGEPATPLGFFLAGSRLMGGCTKHTDKGVFRTALAYFRRAVLTATHTRALYQFQLAHAAGHLEDRGLAAEVAEALMALWPASERASHWASYALGKVRVEERP